MNVNLDKNNLFIPFGLNFHTVLFFIISIINGFINDCYQISYGSIMCLITGLLYHSTYNIYLKIVDQFIVILCIIYFIIVGATKTLYFLYTIIILIILIIGYIFLSNGKYGIFFHSILHIFSNIGIYFLVKGCIQTKCIFLKNNE